MVMLRWSKAGDIVVALISGLLATTNCANVAAVEDAAPSEASLMGLPEHIFDRSIVGRTEAPLQSQSDMLHALREVSQSMRQVTSDRLQERQLEWIADFPNPNIAWYRVAVDVVGAYQTKGRKHADTQQSPKKVRFLGKWFSKAKTAKVATPAASAMIPVSRRHLAQLHFIVEQMNVNDERSVIQLRRLLVKACIVQWTEAKLFLINVLGPFRIGAAATMCTPSIEDNEVANDQMGLKLMTVIASANDINIKDTMRHIRESLVLDYRQLYFPFHTPLSSAINKRKFGLARFLLEEGADPQVIVGLDRSTALHVAASMNDADMIKLLIRYGASVNARDSVQATPLHRAREAAAAKVLLKHGADVHAWSDLIGTPLLNQVSKYEETDSVRLLLEAGADPREKTRDGMTAVALAVKQPVRGLDLLRVLFSDPRSFETLMMQSQSGFTPLHEAADAKNPDIVRYLLDIYNDTFPELKLSSEREDAPLLGSVYKALAKIEKMLKDKKARVD
jgi:hypothetical protein